MNDTIPVGTIMCFPATTVPDKWLLCDGNGFDTAKYPQLATLLGSSFTPSLISRFPIGASAARPAKSSGGRTTATVDYLKRHGHFFGDSGGLHTHWGTADGWSLYAGEHQHDILMNVFPAWLNTNSSEAPYVVGDGASTKETTEAPLHNHGGVTEYANTDHTHSVNNFGVEFPTVLPPYVTGLFLIRALP